MASCGFGTTFGFDGDVTMLCIGPSHIYTKADIFLVLARKFKKIFLTYLVVIAWYCCLTNSTIFDESFVNFPARDPATISLNPL